MESNERMAPSGHQQQQQARYRGDEMTLPLLILNTGCEMIYVLEQRLRAQAILVERARQVLMDIVAVLVSPSFTDALFESQDICSFSEAKGICEKLAHCSIMKLNAVSMQKLYDLVSMGFKHQLLSVAEPRQLLSVTLTHLSTVHALLGLQSPSSDRAIATAAHFEALTARLVDVYGSFSEAQWWALRRALTGFFQDRRTKISPLLHEGLQYSDGGMVLKVEGPLPQGVELPGTIRYYNDNYNNYPSSSRPSSNAPAPSASSSASSSSSSSMPPSSSSKADLQYRSDRVDRLVNPAVFVASTTERAAAQSSIGSNRYADSSAAPSSARGGATMPLSAALGDLEGAATTGAEHQHLPSSSSSSLLSSSSVSSSSRSMELMLGLLSSSAKAASSAASCSGEGDGFALNLDFFGASSSSLPGDGSGEGTSVEVFNASTTAAMAKRSKLFDDDDDDGAERKTGERGSSKPGEEDAETDSKKTESKKDDSSALGDGDDLLSLMDNL